MNKIVYSDIMLVKASRMRKHSDIRYALISPI